MLRLVAALLVLLAASAPAAAGERPVVVELFTSQGCSSCPAADSLLGELSRRPGILALSLSVDYWDYIGWKDTLASPTFSKRQRAYAHARGDRAVYTPQAIVAGAEHRVGSDRKALEKAIADARAAQPDVDVSLQRSADGITASIGAGTGSEDAEIILVLFAPAETVKITRGENAGRTITYHNVVKRLVRVGTWTGESMQLSLPAPPPGQRCAVLVQAGDTDTPGRILGAATI